VIKGFTNFHLPLLFLPFPAPATAPKKGTNFISLQLLHRHITFTPCKPKLAQTFSTMQQVTRQRSIAGLFSALRALQRLSQ
jgi:hypothetical protein